jgi:hypothetical protein
MESRVTRYSFAVAAVFGLLSSSPVFAAGQSPEAPVAAAPEPAPAAAPDTPPAEPAPTPTPCCVVPAGTLVVVEVTEALDAATARPGWMFGLKLVAPIIVDGVTLAPAGTIGRGEVVDAKAANLGGRPARLILAARYLDVAPPAGSADAPVRIKLQSLKLGGGGQDNSGVALTATMVVGVVGMLVPGGNIAYPAGTHATAKVATAVTFADPGAVQAVAPAEPAAPAEPPAPAPAPTT